MGAAARKARSLQCLHLLRRGSVRADLTEAGGQKRLEEASARGRAGAASGPSTRRAHTHHALLVIAGCAGAGCAGAVQLCVTLVREGRELALLRREEPEEVVVADLPDRHPQPRTRV